MREAFQRFRETIAEKEREQMGAHAEAFMAYMDELRRDYEDVEREIKEAKVNKRTRLLDDYQNSREWQQDSQFEGQTDEMNAVQKVKSRDYCHEYLERQKPLFDEISELDDLLRKYKPQVAKFQLGKQGLLESLKKSGSKSSRRDFSRKKSEGLKASVVQYTKSSDRFAATTKGKKYATVGGLGLK